MSGPIVIRLALTALAALSLVLAYCLGLFACWMHGASQAALWGWMVCGAFLLMPCFELLSRWARRVTP